MLIHPPLINDSIDKKYILIQKDDNHYILDKFNNIITSLNLLNMNDGVKKFTLKHIILLNNETLLCNYVHSNIRNNKYIIYDVIINFNGEVVYLFYEKVLRINHDRTLALTLHGLINLITNEQIFNTSITKNSFFIQ